ncbi:DUF1552 domain-containing protein [Marinicellulosiphila megalodicopiae]|uniref:DUF1552 domain-containing protein n=1 Tax=Marinicellulosiphila megalodicopiae TaxID=2724896 RepID=UPI003BB01ADE
MNRRSLIKSISAGSLAAGPMLSLLTRSALAADSAQRIRTLFIFTPNGCVPDLFFPPKGSRVLPEQTAPLQSVYDQCVFMDGLAMFGNAGTHEGGTIKCLTGYTGATSNAPATSSIDVLMGKQDWANRATTQISTPSVQMGVDVRWKDDTRKISWDEGSGLGSIDDPRIVFNNLFGSLSANTGDTTPVSTERHSQLKIFDVINDELKGIRSSLGSIEKTRLDQHTEAMSVLEARLNRDYPSGGTGGGTPIICTAPDVNLNGITDASLQNNVIEISDIQQDIAIQALSCNITRSLTFSYSHSVSPTVLEGLSQGDHDLSHLSGSAHTQSKAKWSAEIAKFIEKLANTPDIDGSLLDNTIICVVSDVGDAAIHDHYRMPMMLAGGKNAGLATGRSLDFRGFGRSGKKGDGKEAEVAISHSDILSTCAAQAGYDGIVMEGTDNIQTSMWTGASDTPI